MKYINKKDYYNDPLGESKDPNNIAYWSKERKIQEQKDYYNKLGMESAEQDLIESIKLDYLLGIATLLGDFKTNIATLIDERDLATGKAKIEVSEKLLGLLFPSVKDPKQLSIPNLDIDKMIEGLSKLTEKNI